MQLQVTNKNETEDYLVRKLGVVGQMAEEVKMEENLGRDAQ